MKKLATDLQKTLQEANAQAQRLADLLTTNRGVWGADRQWIDLSAVHEVHSVVVLLDDVGPLSLSMDELVRQQIVTTAAVPWAVSLHDLLVFSRVMSRPAQFLEYLRRRRDKRFAMLTRAVDELDILMWFLQGGMHIEPDPELVASQIPFDRPTRNHDRKLFETQSPIRVGTLTDPLDACFYWEDGLSSTASAKPVRREHDGIEAVLDDLERLKVPGWFRFGADLVSLGGSAQQRITQSISQAKREARGGTRERSMATHGTSLHGSWLFAVSVATEGLSRGHLPEYLAAKRFQTKSSRAMMLMFTPDGRLLDTLYLDESTVSTKAEECIYESAPLYSLDRTFGVTPPSARRATRRLRGKPKGRRS